MSSIILVRELWGFRSDVTQERVLLGHPSFPAGRPCRYSRGGRLIPASKYQHSSGVGSCMMDGIFNLQLASSAPLGCVSQAASFDLDELVMISLSIA